MWFSGVLRRLVAISPMLDIGQNVISSKWSGILLYYARSAVVHSQEADELRRQLESARDSTARELTFTRSELEKYQRDYASASKQVLFAVITRKNWPCFGQLQRTFQVQHLLFVLERERRGDEEMSNNDEDNARLFDNIAQLQKYSAE